MRPFTLALALCLATPALAQDPPTSKSLEFVTQNQLDGNLYNLLAATIPSLEAGQAIFQACGEVKTEVTFEDAYKKVQDDLGVQWRHALADTYARHLSEDEMAELTKIGQTAVAERLSNPEIISDLQETLTPILNLAIGTQVNSMIDVADEICAN